MKAVLLLILLAIAVNAGAQKSKQDLSKAYSSADRKAILETLRLKLRPDLKLVPKLVVSRLVAKEGFAFFSGHAKNSKGGEIDFKKTVYREEVEQGIFDGDGTTALLKKTGKNWKVLTYVVGPTDVPWGCWWKAYKAPKDIFDYTEKNCDWVK